MAEIREVSHIVREGDCVGPYRIEKVIPGNRGGFAQMAVASRLASGDERELVAIKFARTDDAGSTDPELFSRALSNEVETLRQLKHPGIVRLYPIQVAERRYSYIARAVNLPNAPWYFVMEYLSGGSLDSLIDEYKALSLRLAVEIAHQVGEALDYVHTSGYAHLDIKTNNVLFRRPPDPSTPLEAVLIDFGAAQKAVRRAEVEAGALVYLAPERVEVLVGRKPPESVVNKSAADVYALGVTLYCMLAGQLPFKGRRDDITTAILNDPPTHPAEVNRELGNYPELNNLILQMLEKRPERRPTVKDVLTRLDQMVPPPRVGAATELPSAPRRHSSGWKYATAALGAIALIEAAGTLALWRRVSPEAASQGQAVMTSSAEKTGQPVLRGVVPTVPALPSTVSTTVPTLVRASRTVTIPAGGLLVSTPQDEFEGSPAAPSVSGSEPTLVPTYTPRPTSTPEPTAAATSATTPTQ